MVGVGCFNILGATSNNFNPTPGIPQEYDSTPGCLVSVYPRQATHVLFTKYGTVKFECKLNNVNPHIIRNQYQIQNKIEVTLNEDRYCNYVITRQIQNSNIPFKYQVNLPWNTLVGLPKAFQRKTNWKYWIKYIKPIWCPQHNIKMFSCCTCMGSLIIKAILSGNSSDIRDISPL